MTWQGCSLSSRPLITGTLALRASSRTFSLLKARYMMPSTLRLRPLAVSAIVSPRPSCRSLGLRKRAWPPSCVMPTSNETRVRVEAFSKIIARLLPRSGSYGSPAFVRFLILAASSRRPTRSSFTSRIEIRSRFSPMDLRPIRGFVQNTCASPASEASNKLARMRERGAETLEGGRAPAGGAGAGCPEAKDEYLGRHPRIDSAVCGEHRGPRLPVERPRLDCRDWHRNRPPARGIPPGARPDCCLTGKASEQLRAASNQCWRGTTEPRTAFRAFDVGLGRLRNNSEKSSSPLAPSRYAVTCLPSRS